MNQRWALGTGVVLLFVSGALLAQEPKAEKKLDLSPRYLLIGGTSTSSMKEKLNEAAAAGYRILFADPTSSREMLFALEKVNQPTDKVYVLLSDEMPEVLQAKFNAVGAEGLRLLPRAMTTRHKQLRGWLPSLLYEDIEIVVVMEGTPTPWRYLVLQEPETLGELLGRAVRGGAVHSLEEQLAKRVEEGYAVAGLLALPGEEEGTPQLSEAERIPGKHLVILETHTPDEAAGKPRERSETPPSQRYLLLRASLTSELQTRLTKAAAEGYRILATSSIPGTSRLAVMLERVGQPLDTPEYRVLATAKISTMQKELDQAAAQGFRLVPGTLMVKAESLTNLFLGPVPEVVLVMEKPRGSSIRYQYRLLAARRISALQKKITQAASEGYELVGLVTHNERLAFMEKAIAP